jgi:ATP-dependent exoDNAse (exonuclease V) beta subunit
MIVAGIAARLINANDYPIGSGLIAVILRDSSRFKSYENALRAKGISARMVEKGSPLDPDGDAVHIVTAHSSKGLGFPFVIVPDVSDRYYPPGHVYEKLSDPDQRAEMLATEQRLLYVALSRAAHRLYMITDSAQPSPLVSKLDRDAYWADLITHRA